MLDIDLLKEKAKAVDSIYQRLFCFFQNIPDLCLMGSKDSLKFNRAWETTLAIKDGSSNLSLESVVHPDDLEKVRANIYLKESLFTCRLRTTDGSYQIYVWSSASPDGDFFYATGRPFLADSHLSIGMDNGINI